MQNIRYIISTMPRSERIGAMAFALTFPAIILAFALVTP